MASPHTVTTMEQMIADFSGLMKNVYGKTKMAKSGIHIKPSRRGLFTAKAKRHGKSVQAYAAFVLANKGRFSSTLVRQANFARNAAKWKKG